MVIMDLDQTGVHNRPPKNRDPNDIIGRTFIGGVKMNKTLVALLALCLIMAGAALAVEEEGVITPEDILYDAATLIEDVQYDLTEDSQEKALMQNEFARRRFQAVRELAGKNSKQIGEVLTALAGHERELGRLIDDVTNEDVILLVTQASERRGQDLLLMSQDENLPEEARQGMLKALANQEMAMEKFREAMEKAGLNRDPEKGNAPANPGPPPVQPPAGLNRDPEKGNAPANPGPPPVQPPKKPQGTR